MAKDPAMLFYTKDFLTGVALLSMKERGQYITLLCLQQQLGHMSLKQMEMAVGKLSPGVLSKYVRDEEGMYYNRRAEIEIGKRKAHCEKQKENIRRRWEKDTTEDTTAIPEEYHGINHGINHGITTVIPLANANANTQVISSSQGKNEGNRLREEQFDMFWSVYPKKVGKQAARKAFEKVPGSAYPKLIPAVEEQKQSLQWQREGGRFIPNPATWLNQGRWDDEVAGGREKSRAAQELDESYAMMRRWADG